MKKEELLDTYMKVGIGVCFTAAFIFGFLYITQNNKPVQIERIIQNNTVYVQPEVSKLNSTDINNAIMQVVAIQEESPQKSKTPVGCVDCANAPGNPIGIVIGSNCYFAYLYRKDMKLSELKRELFNAGRVNDWLFGHCKNCDKDLYCAVRI